MLRNLVHGGTLIRVIAVELEIDELEGARRIRELEFETHPR